VDKDEHDERMKEALDRAMRSGARPQELLAGLFIAFALAEPTAVLVRRAREIKAPMSLLLEVIPKIWAAQEAEDNAPKVAAEAIEKARKG
jgi:hypothetical protein